MSLATESSPMSKARSLAFLLAGALACLAAPLTPLHAQEATGTITGQVVDSASRQPLADVSVVVEGTPRGAVTRVDGSFTISGVPAGTHLVRARRIGFATQGQNVTVSSGGTVSVTFALTRQAAILEQMVVVGYGSQQRSTI